ncbi:hypothetical protein LNKW23_09800 [Paralimibaculum aggregatum]|uniref:O-antigen/teichoic acid export membrane protein n=1 Tax=Paralimibaculum aggregatum TaxID=3036245 RepID=A0ABQ6LEJ6_9RHOB|nr:oligosaccharide flippase family protein [Limibaculum sp. NKW23]GMG81767.1 hypothetical protein LNKW23_09800 [Limibaculum sp. NKW23]
MSFHRSLVWTVAQFALVLAIELAGLAVLARLLTPQETGWFAAALAVLLLAQFVGGFGLFVAVQRAEALDAGFRANALAIALTASGAVTAVLALLLALPSGALIGRVPDALLAAMLPLVLVNAVAILAHAELLRARRFRCIFFVRLAGSAAYPACAVPLAAAGQGPAALLAGLAAASLVHCALCLLATGGGFLVRPGFRGMGRTARLAGTVFAANAAQQASESLTPLLIGRIAGFAALGQFARADDLVRQSRRVVQETVMPVLVPYVFAAARERAALRPRYLAALGNLTAVSWPAAGLLAVLAQRLVAVLLGPQWAAVPEVLAILSALLALFPVLAVSQIYLIALGRERQMLAVQLGATLLTLALVAALAGSGLAAACWALVGAAALHALWRVRMVARRLGLGAGEIAAALARNLPLALATVLPVAALSAALSAALEGGLWRDLAVIGLSAPLAAGAWAAAIFGLGHPLAAEFRRLWPGAAGGDQPSAQ